MKTPTQLLACAERELNLRYSTFPRWVLQGKMTQEKATHEIECMSQIRDVLRRQKLLDEISEEMKSQQTLPL